MSTQRARRWRPVRQPPSRKRTCNLLARLPTRPLSSPSIETLRGPNEPDSRVLNKPLSRQGAAWADPPVAPAKGHTALPGPAQAAPRRIKDFWEMQAGQPSGWWGRNLNVQSWSRRNWSPWPWPQARPRRQHSNRCENCGRCKCEECTCPRTLPSCWMCGPQVPLLGNNSNGLRHLRLLRQGSLLPLLSDDEDVCADKPLLLHPVALLHAGTAISVMALFLPCLLCYPPGEGLRALCQACYDCNSRPGCRCKNKGVRNKRGLGSWSSTGKITLSGTIFRAVGKYSQIVVVLALLDQEGTLDWQNTGLKWFRLFFLFSYLLSLFYFTL